MFAATVLSAGASTRMGSPKALLDFHGRSFLQSILDTVADLGLRCYVALGHDAANILTKHDLRHVTVVMNENLAAGPIESVRASIRAIGNEPVEALLVWPVDFPHVRSDTVIALLARFREADHPAVVVPEYLGSSGHPVVFGNVVFGELLEAPDSDGARSVVRRDPSRVARVRVSDPAVTDSVNTLESYRDLIRRTAR